MTTETQKAAIHLQSQVTIQRLLSALKLARKANGSMLCDTNTHRQYCDCVGELVDKAIADAEEMPTC